MPAVSAGTDRPEVPAARFRERLIRAADGAGDAGFDGLLVGVGADLRYLAGYAAIPLERLTMLVVPARGRPTLVVPRLEVLPARSCPAARADLVDVVAWEETDRPHRLVAELVGAGREQAAVRAVAVSDTLWASHVLALQGALPGTTFGLATTVLRDLRMVKDATEVELLGRAASAADRTLAAVAHGRLIGRTEADVSAEIRRRLVDEGHDHAAFAIVGSGPNSASPHHDATDRVIGAGEPIVFDIGGSLGGYGSDITRTVWVTGGDPATGPIGSFVRLYGVLQAAQAEASHAVRPGVTCERIDAVAREIIATSGYGPQFIHRTGHGIGLEEHEEPYIVAGNTEPIREGMAFSVEPGIYDEGRYGARIEDIVVCGADGPIILNQLDRDLLVVDGR